MTTDLSFKTFLTTTAVVGEIIPDAKVLERLVLASNGISTANDLVRWGRERFPDQFNPDPRKLIGMRKDLMKLWAAFLEWREGGAA